MVALLIEGGRATLAWAGDSRAYRLRRGVLERLTRDHSLVQELLDRGEIGEAEAERHPQRNVVTRAVGAGDAGRSPPSPISPSRRASVLLLCSDGLTRCVPDAEIADAARRGGAIRAGRAAPSSRRRWRRGRPTTSRRWWSAIGEAGR